MLEPYEWKRSRTVLRRERASNRPDLADYGNNMVRDAIQKFPGRVAGYVTINPNYPEDMEHELERCFAMPGFRAIKLHPSCHGRAVDYQAYEPVYRYAQEHGLALLIHTWGYGDVSAIDRLADRYPGARFIIAHMGGDPQTMEIALDVLNRHDNVFGDFAISTAQEGNVEWMVAQAGSKKLLFGTDMPFYDPCFTLARVAMAKISDEEKRDIFCGNVSRLLRL